MQDPIIKPSMKPGAAGPDRYVKRRRAAERVGIASVVAAALFGLGCPPPEAEVMQPNVAPPPALPPPETAPVAKTAVSHVGIKVMYRDDWFGGVTLLGVDPQGPRAVVRLEAESPARLNIDTIDLTRGARSDRWEVKDGPTRAAILGRGFEMSSYAESSIAKLAGVVGTLGPWHMRSSLAAPTFAVSADGASVLFGAPPADGRDGDWLVAVDRNGTHPRRVDEGLRASYSPVFSPDGSHFAFRGCTASPCDYGLFVAALGQKPRRVGGVAGATPPVFSKTGDALYTVGDGQKRGARCLYKAMTNGSGASQPITCVQSLEDVGFSEDPEGRTGVVSGVRGVPGQQQVDFTWVLLDDGTILQEHTVDRAVGGGVINGAGLLALPMQKGGLAIVDLVNNRRVLLPDIDGWFFGFDGGRWLGDWLILLRKPAQMKGYEIVGIDARTLLGGT